MKIKVNAESLQTAFKQMATVIPMKHDLNILTCIKMITRKNQLILVGKNSICEKRIKVDCECEGATEMTTQFAKVNKFVSSLPSDKVININNKEKHIDVTCGRTKAKMPLLAGEFPTMTAGSLDELEVDPLELLNAIETVEFAAPMDNYKKIFNCVAICKSSDGVDVVGADGVVLAINSIEGSLPKDSILLATKAHGSSAVALLKSSLTGTCQLATDGNLIFVKDVDSETAVQLVDGRYVNYSAAVPKAGLLHGLTFEAEAMSGALKRITTIVSDQIKGRCLIQLEDGSSDAVLHGWHITGDASEIHESVPISNSESAQLNIAYNPQRLLKCIQKLSGDQVKANIYNTKTSSMVMTDKNTTLVLASVMV